MSVHLVISPHLDDAVLSLGAPMRKWRRAGDQVTVVTVFSGGPEGTDTPAAIEDRRRYDGDPITVRLAEDNRALSMLDVGTIRLGFPEVVYRWRSDGAPRCRTLEDIFDPVLSDDDADVARRVASALRPLIATGSVVHAPAGVGDHSDHVIVREAVESLFLPGRDIGARLEQYADLPYVFRSRTESRSSGWDVSPDDVAEWIAAIECYESQIPIMFSGDDWRDDFIRWAAPNATHSPPDERPAGCVTGFFRPSLDSSSSVQALFVQRSVVSVRGLELIRAKRLFQTILFVSILGPGLIRV